MVAQAQRVINVMRDTVARSTRNGATIGYRYGVVNGYESNGHSVEVALAGDENALTSDVRVPAGAYLNAGDYVMVAQTIDGDYWVEQVLHQNIYSVLALDASNGRIMVGSGSSYAMSPGTEGQLLFSGGSNAPVYWADNFSVEVRLHVKNGTVSTIGAGKVVYITGADGQTPTVALADADAEVTSSSTIGVTNESITASGTGYIITKGILRGMDTSAFSAGAEVWLSSTAGGLTATRPATPAHAVRVGNVVKSHASSGELLVDIHNGSEISELHDVLIASTPSNGDVLKYNSAGAYWAPGAASVVAALDDLTDVTISSPSNTQVLTYNGSGWVNQTPSSHSYTGISMARTANQSVNNTTDVAVDFNTGNTTKYWDTDSWHSLSSNSTKIYPKTSGKSLVTASVAFASNGTGNRWLYLYVNGSVSGGVASGTLIGRATVSAASGAQTWLSAAGAYEFNGSTDYVEVYVQQSSGSPLNVAHAVVSAQLFGGVKGDTGTAGATGATGATGPEGGTTLVTSSSATNTSVADAATAQTILASNASRKGFSIYNDSAQVAYVKFGSSATTTDFTMKLAAYGFYEMFGDCLYTGAITAIWASDSTGSARVTEW